MSRLSTTLIAIAMGATLAVGCSSPTESGISTNRPVGPGDGTVARKCDQDRKALRRVDGIDEKPFAPRHERNRLSRRRPQSAIAGRQRHIPSQHVVVAEQRRASEKRFQLA